MVIEEIAVNLPSGGGGGGGGGLGFVTAADPGPGYS